MSRVLHPVLTPGERRRLLRDGINRFNRGEFFDAHEIWEEVWRSNLPEPRKLLQGLIQVAAGLHQILDLHRTIGPRNTLAKARAHLEPYAPAALGLDVHGVLESVGRWQIWLETPTEERRPAVPELRVLDQDAVG
jgi:predicted metal-dependent hydrolase